LAGDIFEVSFLTTVLLSFQLPVTVNIVDPEFFFSYLDPDSTFQIVSDPDPVSDPPRLGIFYGKINLYFLKY
jgi:hypothetical protein